MLHRCSPPCEIQLGPSFVALGLNPRKASSTSPSTGRVTSMPSLSREPNDRGQDPTRHCEEHSGPRNDGCGRLVHDATPASQRTTSRSISRINWKNATEKQDPHSTVA
jgi:hypothetical protein